jgi:Flp pilus assembly protein CpaB
MQRGRLLIILGVVLGLATLGAVVFLVVGGGILSSFLEESPTPTPGIQIEQQEEIPTVQVIVALQPIPRGAQFVEGAIGRRPWPSPNVPPDYIQDEIETIGKVAKMEILQGQIIQRGMLADERGEGDAAFKIPPGKVAVAFPINRQSSVAYAIQPDDFVDVLITANFRDIDEEFQTTLPNKLSFIVPEFDSETGEQIGFGLTGATDEGRFEVASGDFPAIVFGREEQIPRRVAQLTIQAAKVIKLGPWIEPPPPPPPAEGEGEGEGEVPTPTPNVPEIVTLAVTPQDALVLLWIRQTFIYHELALRAAGEETADHLTEAVTLQYMLTRFNVAVPPKIEFSMEPSEIDLVRQGIRELEEDVKAARELEAEQR